MVLVYVVVVPNGLPRTDEPCCRTGKASGVGRGAMVASEACRSLMGAVSAPPCRILTLCDDVVEVDLLWAESARSALRRPTGSFRPGEGHRGQQDVSGGHGPHVGQDHRVSADRHSTTAPDGATQDHCVADSR